MFKNRLFHAIVGGSMLRARTCFSPRTTGVFSDVVPASAGSKRLVGSLPVGSHGAGLRVFPDLHRGRMGSQTEAAFLRTAS